jgi:hypothetical protein
MSLTGSFEGWERSCFIARVTIFRPRKFQAVPVGFWQHAFKGRFWTHSRGRATEPEDVRIGDGVRHTEGGFDVVNCESCAIARACSLTGALRQSLIAFMVVLDNYTLAAINAANTAAKAA